MRSKRTRLKYVFALSEYISGYKIKLLLSIIIHGIFKLMPILIGFATSLIIGEAISGDLDTSFRYLYIILAMITLNALLNYLDILVSHDMAYRILTELRGRAFDKITEIAPGGMDSEESGDIMATILEDIEILEWFFAHTINQIVVALVLPILSLAVLGMFSVWISLVVIIFMSLVISIPAIMKKKSNRQGIELQEKLGKLNAVIIDGVQGLKDIITFRWYSDYLGNLFSRNKKHSEAMERYSLRANNEMILTTLIIGISYIVSSVLILLLFTRGEYELKWVFPLITLSSAIYVPLQETLSMSSNYGRIFGSAERLFYLLEKEPPTEDKGNLKSEDVIKEKSVNNIEFRKVRFVYPSRKGKKDASICREISFSVKTGETAVLVGKSGCGKSTCIKLLQRFWDVDDGAILINDIDIKDIRLDELRKIISVVPQDTYIFNMSIADNLRLAKPNATEEEIIFALKEANAYDFVSNLPEGAATVVGERGMRLSCGEKQRISIAQAFLRDSEILILDEASANLDAVNESIVNESIERLKKGRLTLMIAHRISTIKNAEKIIVIKDGLIEDSGSYDSLIERSKYFNYLTGYEYE